MASNDQWPPVASASKNPPKINGNKRNIKESQQKILSVVNEMFGSALEPDVILQVLQNSNWELQPSIEGLITLTETVENPPMRNDLSAREMIDKTVAKDPLTRRLRDNKMEAEAEPTMRSKSEKPKRTAAKNRMGSFCGNIAKLKSSGENNNVMMDGDLFFNDMHRYGASGPKIPEETWPKVRPPSFGDLPDISKGGGCMPPVGELNSRNIGRKTSHDTAVPVETKRKERFLETKAAAEKKEFNRPEEKVGHLEDKSNVRKTESESLCGLKVQYRLSGMENSSDDDDADVVIEDESSDYKINVASSVSISVSQFLSPSSQTAPQRTHPEIHMINTPSPPQTPQRKIHEGTLKRIKSAIQTGSKILILLRGLPGSGKSTLARQIVASTIGGNSADFIFNTDDFFVTLGGGIFHFDPSRLQEAHNTNHKRVWNAMKQGRSPIIVDNTNVEAWEMRPYAAMAVENGYIVEILEPNTPWAENVSELANKNTHNVPKSKIRERYQRYERGLTGNKLLDKFTLKYSGKNVPPQPRRVPPIAAKLETKKAPLTMADFKSNWAGNEKNNFVLTTQDIESMQNIDESHCAIVNDGSSDSSDNPEMSSTCVDKIFQDYLQELQDSDDESFEMLDGATTSPADVEKVNKDESPIDTPTDEKIGEATKNTSPQQIFGAIGSERKGSLSVASSIPNPESAEKSSDIVQDEKKDNVLSQCWDFTLLLGPYKIHSRHNMTKLGSKFSGNSTEDGKIIDEDGFVSETQIESEISQAQLVVETEKNIVESVEYDEDNVNESSDIPNSEVDRVVEKKSDASTKMVDESKVPSAFGSFLNLIKTSILGDDRSSIDAKHDILNDPDDSSIYAKVPVEEKAYSDLSTNPFRKEMLESSSEELIADNINSISWKESPFPIDTKISFPIGRPIEIEIDSVPKVDASTNTTYYDFNVSFVGGTSEPGYRELVATSRSINEPNSNLIKIQAPPLKLMLDKSSMTSEENILAEESILNPDKGKHSGDRIKELMELFPHIPIESLTAFYVQQCKRNFDWAVEVLLDDAPNAFTLKGFEMRPLENQLPETEKIINKKEHEKLKQRSHSSSPRHRRNKSKDFRTFSMEFVQDCYWPSGDSSNASDKNSLPIKDDDDDDDDAIYQQMYQHAASAANLPVESGEIPSSSSEEDYDEEIQLNFGREFINQLEKTFGNPDFAFPDEFTPSIRIKKSMAEELYALWIESMYRQLNARHAQLDEMIAKDEAIARALVREEMMEPVKEPVVPNFEEIMDMEMALASYKNELKEKIARETPNDLASRLSRQMLYESLPDIDQQTLSEILKAHDGNFKETCETIETSTGRKISKTESLKKQQSLLERVNEESKNRGIVQNSKSTPVIVVRPEVSSTGAKGSSYKSALERGCEARKEAEKQFSLRIDYINKAAEAYRKGYPDVAAYYSQMAKLHSENIEAAHAEAAEAFLSGQITGNDEDDNTLDLHNLFVPEALQALDIFLEQQSKKLSKSCKRTLILFIITGRGARSNNGLSRIKPAVSKKLITRNIRFTEANPGCLKVTLTKKNAIFE